MPRLAFTIILLSFGFTAPFPQQPAPKTAVPTCSFSEIYKADGWTIPGLLNAKVKYRAPYQNVPGVFVTEFLPLEPETTITNVRGSYSVSGRLMIQDAPIRILKLRGWEYEGRLFAYSVEYEIQAMENGARVALGAATAVMFYDVDGSGLFKVRKPGGSRPFGIPDMPPNTPKREVDGGQYSSCWCAGCPTLFVAKDGRVPQPLAFKGAGLDSPRPYCPE